MGLHSAIYYHLILLHISAICHLSLLCITGRLFALPLDDHFPSSVLLNPFVMALKAWPLIAFYGQTITHTHTQTCGAYKCVHIRLLQPCVFALCVCVLVVIWCFFFLFIFFEMHFAAFYLLFHRLDVVACIHFALPPLHACACVSLSHFASACVCVCVCISYLRLLQFIYCMYICLYRI